MGNLVNVTSPQFEGYAAFGISAASLTGKAMTAAAFFEGDANYQNVTLTIDFYDDADMTVFRETTVFQLTLSEERPYEGSETCLWYPQSVGYFQGEFAFDLGTGDTFSFYVCGQNVNAFDTFNGQIYGAVTVDVPFLGTKHLQYFSNMSGYIMEAFGRRFYYGFSTFLSVIDGTSACASSSIFIPTPRFSPIVLVVTDGAGIDGVPGTIAGFTLIVQPPSNTVSSNFITGAPQSDLQYPDFCIKGPEYLQKCLGINPFPPTTSTSTSDTTEQESTTTEVIETTTEQEVVITTTEGDTNSTNSTDDGSPDNQGNSILLIVPFLALAVIVF